jgi:hypothetical protein
MNVRDVESAIMEASVKNEKIINDAMFEYYRPMVDAQIGAFWQKLPLEIKGQLAMNMPQQFKAVEKGLTNGKRME